MTEPTPPPGRPDDAETPGFDASVELVHASIDGELTDDESAAVQVDEAWRLRVEAARRSVDTVQAAIGLPPIDEDRREAHLSTALAAFDEAHGKGTVADAASLGDHRAAPRTGDELAHRRRAMEWVRRAPLGIAAAVLAAILVVGATQLGDDGGDDVAVLNETGGDALEEAGEDAMVVSGEPSDDMATEGAGGGAPVADESDGDDSAYETTSRAGTQTFTLASEPESLEEFVAAVAAAAHGEADHPSPAAPDATFDGPCDRREIARLASTADNVDDLTIVAARLDGRSVVGVIDRTDPSQVTVIDLDRCDVIAVRAP